MGGKAPRPAPQIDYAARDQHRRSIADVFRKNMLFARQGRGATAGVSAGGRGSTRGGNTVGQSIISGSVGFGTGT